MNVPAGSAAERRSTLPHISLHGPKELTEEAELWLTRLLRSSDTITIHNNFIQHFGVEEQRQVAQLSAPGRAHIQECFHKGHAFITVSGDSQSDVIMAALQVEAMLCNTQRLFTSEEECTMFGNTQWMFTREEERAMPPPSAAHSVTFQRTPVDADNRLFADRVSLFKKEGLRLVKMESVVNQTQMNLFDIKKKQLQNFSVNKMYQRIPAQFCEMVSHVGFHTEVAPPADPMYGEGIYFVATVKRAMKVWKELSERYLYFVEAEVLTGKSRPGSPGLIVPVTGPDGVIYDSASGGPDICVVGSGNQALPRYILTCQRL